MSDESPRDEDPAPDAPDGEGQPTEETAPAAEGSPAAPPPPPPAESPPQARSGFYVPRRAALVAGAVIAVLVLFFGGFAIGQRTDGDGDHEGREGTELPGREGGGNDEGRGPRPTSGVFLGVATRDATEGQQGAEVLEVVSGSSAEQAGLQVGDVITAVDGSSVTSTSDLTQRVRGHESGDQVTITYSRGGNSAETQVTLGSRSTSTNQNA
jgi:S1-C subfamily serine protease